MAVEIACMLFVAYIFIAAKWTITFNIPCDNLCYFLERIFPKVVGILILLYVIAKYTLKIK